ncbi:MAG TPA: amino acid ABC transporter ATP-binding protein, partial [Baekduia sp.]|nr:amino acid ABC transporter ATP-binding protein [Baekduia sp.]
MAGEALVELRGVRKVFGDNVVLDGIDLSIAKGEAIVVAGPSGSGKSTMLRCINGLETIDGGTLTVGGQRVDVTGKELARLRADIGMVFQQFNLFPHMTVERNITLAPTKVKGIAEADAKRRARELLERVGIPEKAGAYPADLSGGQQQRVAIARALVHNPRLIVCDEPTSALDEKTGHKVMELMRELALQDGRALVVVTHDARIFEFADRIAKMNDGRVEKVVT